MGSSNQTAKRTIDHGALGLSPEEARLLGDLAEAQAELEARYGDLYQNSASPVFRSVWNRGVDMKVWSPPPLEIPPAYRSVMEESLGLAQRYKDNGDIYDGEGKVNPKLIADLGRAGFWGQLVSKQYGGLGTPFRLFSHCVTKMASIEGTIAGLASVHQCIGAVNPLNFFGSDEQRQRWLPRLATGELQSGFALTEPGAGSDLQAVRTTAVLDGDHYVVNGEKLFITNVHVGRMIALVCRIEKDLRVLMVELPAQENEHFRLRRYGLHALSHAYNHGLIFKDLRVPKENLLGDKGLKIAYNGLNLGRVVVCAGSAGAIRRMLANMPRWAEFRKTYGQSISKRALVQERAGVMAALITGCDALVDWCSYLLDAGYRGEMECVVAKIFGSEAQKFAAIELFMKTHGGRSFLHGHLFGDNIGDFLAPCIYEGEGDMLAMAFLGTLIESHGLHFFEPIAKREQSSGIRFNPLNPLQLWQFRDLLMPYAKWMASERLTPPRVPDLSNLAPALRAQASFAIRELQKIPVQASGLMTKFQKKLPDMQCQMRDLSLKVQNLIVMLCTAVHAGRSSDQDVQAAGDVMCDILRLRVKGGKPNDAFYRKVSKLGQRVLTTGDQETSFTRGSPSEEIMMKYEA